MGGRGSNSGGGGGKIPAGGGFEYKFNNKTMVIQKTSSGIILVNDKPRTMSNSELDKLFESKKNAEGFKVLTKAELEKRRKKRYEDYNSHDYELIQTGKGRGKVYRPRKGK